ncbi:hypothetical protein, partial [Pseudomonas siliginis]|uniref:hypothetical protein n=1 Tax=Pseudomonas siliginis TaxID=2842346 RepID=UPI001C3DBEC4
HGLTPKGKEHMNNHLMDQYLIDLLCTPAKQRSRHKIHEVITQIAAIAQLEERFEIKADWTQYQLMELQREAMELETIAELLNATPTFDHGDFAFNIRKTELDWRASLTMLLTNAGAQAGNKYISRHGGTAEEAVLNLRTTVRTWIS